MESLNTCDRMSNGSENGILLPSLPSVPVESLNLWHRFCPQSYTMTCSGSTQSEVS